MSHVVINGRAYPSMSLVIGLAACSATCDRFRLVSSTPTEATWETRRTDSDETRTFTVTIDGVGPLGPVAARHPAAWLSRVCAYKLALLVYRLEIETALREAGIALPEAAQ
jgi:hypothetical protein